MRGARAKRLRRLAESICPAPRAEYERDPRHHRIRRLTNRCARGVYQALKKRFA